MTLNALTNWLSQDRAMKSLSSRSGTKQAQTTMNLLAAQERIASPSPTLDKALEDPLVQKQL